MNLDRRLFKQLSRAKAALALAVLAAFLAGIATVLQARQVSQVIAGAFLEAQTLAALMPLLWNILAIVFARAALTYIGELAAQAVAQRVKNHLREALARRLFDLGPAYAQGERSGELMNTVTQGVEALDAYFSQFLPQLALAGLLPVAYLVVVFPLDPLSGLILLLTGPLIPLFMFLIGSHAESLTRRQFTALGRMSAYFLDTLQGLSTLKMLGRSQEQAGRIAQVSEQYRQATLSVLRVTFLSALALELLSTMGTAIIAVEIGLRLLYGRMGFESAFFLLLLAPEFYQPLRNLGLRFHASMSGVSAARRIFEVFEQPLPGDAERHNSHFPRPEVPGIPTHPSARGAEILPQRPVHRAGILSHHPIRRAGTPTRRFVHSILPRRSPKRERSSPALVNFRSIIRAPFTIEFSAVHYTYPSQGESRPEALNGISLRILSGQIVALVGSSGAGKSTVASLLLRFLAPHSGHILINGLPLGTIPMDTWRDQIAWVPQQPYLFHGTLADNLRVASPGASLGAMNRALEQARLIDFVAGLPDGLDTPIGEGGARLSGGQAQRLALARAFLRDAPILILDEPTAHLDIEQERLLQDTIRRLCAGRTVLVIAHRLSTAVQADQIVVLEQGRVVECGQHSLLSQQGGAYARLLSAYHGEGA